MINQKGSIQIYLIITLLVLGAFFYLKNTSQNQNPLSNANQKVAQDQKTTNNPSSSAEITITKEGFLPKTITVAKNQLVIWKNLENKTHQIISEENGIESESLAINDQFVYLFEKKGVYKYKDSLNPGYEGTIVVE